MMAHHPPGHLGNTTSSSITTFQCLAAGISSAPARSPSLLYRVSHYLEIIGWAVDCQGGSTCSQMPRQEVPPHSTVQSPLPTYVFPIWTPDSPFANTTSTELSVWSLTWITSRRVVSVNTLPTWTRALSSGRANPARQLCSAVGGPSRGEGVESITLMAGL